MKLTILTAAAALLATPVLAQDSAVQGRSGSTAGGYRTDQGSGPSTQGGPATTGSTSTGSTGGGTTSGQSGTTLPPSQQGSGSNSGGSGPTRQ